MDPAARQPTILPPATHRVLDTDDVDHAREDVSRYLAPHSLTPLTRDATLRTVLHYASLGPIGIGGLSFGPPVEVAVEALEDFYLVEIPLWGRLRLRSGEHEMIATPHRGAVVNPDKRLWKQWDADTGVLIVSLERAALLARAETWADRSLRGILRFDTALDATAGADRAWLALVWAMVRDLEHEQGLTTHPELAVRWGELISDALLLGHPSTHRHLLLREDEPSAGPRALRHLLEQLHTYPERSWTSPEMARAMGVGVAAMERTFTRRLDTTPQDYVRAIRQAVARTTTLRGSEEDATGDMPIGELIRRERQRAGMSESQLAEELAEVSGNPGITRAEVSRWEHGRRIPRPYWRGYLSQALQLPLDQLDHAASVSRARRLG